MWWNFTFLERNSYIGYKSTISPRQLLLYTVALDRKLSLCNKWIYLWSLLPCTPSPPLDNIRVMVIVWRLRGNVIRTAQCCVVWHNVHSQQHTHVSSSYRSSRLGLSHWDPNAMHRGSCLELYYCNMVEWCSWDSSLISKTNWFPSVLWHCWFGHMTCKNRPRYEWDVKPLHYFYYYYLAA